MLTNLFSQCDENKISSIIDNLSANKAKPEIDIYENINLLQKILKEAKKCDSEFTKQVRIISYEEIAIAYSNLGESKESIFYLKKFLNYLESLEEDFSLKKAIGNYLTALEYLNSTSKCNFLKQS